MAEPSKWRRPWRIAVGTTVVVGVTASIVALAAPGESPPVEPAAQAQTEPKRPAPMLQPLALAPAPLWSSEESFDGGAQGAVIRDGLALVTGPSRMAVLDVATGEVRWSLEDGDELDGGAGDSSWNPTGHRAPRLVATADGLAVPVEYERPDREREGIALLSAADGSVVWQEQTGTVDESRRILWAVDDRVALASVATDDTLTTVALDIATGEQRWDEADVWPAAIAGDAALTISSAESLEDPRGAVSLPGGDLAGLDLATGEPRWDLAGESEVELAAGDVTLVRTGDEVVLVDAAGAELGVLGEQRGCVSDGSTLVACPVDYDGVRVFDLATREITTATLDDSFASLAGIVAGRVVLATSEGFRTVDKHGNPIDETFPAGVVAASDTVVAFRSQGESGPVVSLHPLAV